MISQNIFPTKISCNPRTMESYRRNVDTLDNQNKNELNRRSTDGGREGRAVQRRTPKIIENAKKKLVDGWRVFICGHTFNLFSSILTKDFLPGGSRFYGI